MTRKIQDASRKISFENLFLELKRTFRQDILSDIHVIYETSFGKEIIINDKVSFELAIEQLNKIKFNENQIFKFYAYSDNKCSNEDGIKENQDSTLTENSFLSDYKKEDSFCSHSMTEIDSNKNDQLKLLSRINKSFKTPENFKNQKKNKFLFKRRKDIIANQAESRDLIKGTDKYLKKNKDRYKKKRIPPLAKCQAMADLIIEWFLISKDCVKETFGELNKTNINNINAFVEYSTNFNLRVRFQVYFRDQRQKILKKMNKSFSFYQSGINKSWSLEEGKARMTNFLNYATRNIEVITGPISLKDF